MLTECIQRMQDAERDLTSQLDAARITGPTHDDTLTCAAGYRNFVRGCFDYPSQASRYTAPPAAAGETPPHRLLAPTRAQ